MVKIKRLSMIIITLFSLSLLLAACSDSNDNKEPEENTEIGEEPNTDENSQDENVEDENTDDTNSEDANSEDETEGDDGSEETVDHQTGLKFGETGTVISGDVSDNYQMEVTPESIEFIDEYEDENGVQEAWEEVLVKYTAKIKNTGDEAYSLSNIMLPSLAPYAGEEDTASLNHQLSTFDEEITKDGQEITIDDEIAPGEEVTMVSVYDTKKSDEYHLIYGSETDQIVTYAQWEITQTDFK